MNHCGRPECICNNENEIRRVLCPVHGVVKYKGRPVQKTHEAAPATAVTASHERIKFPAEADTTTIARKGTTTTEMTFREKNCTCKNLAPSDMHFKDCPVVSDAGEWEKRLEEDVLMLFHNAEGGISIHEDEYEEFVRILSSFIRSLLHKQKKAIESKYENRE